MKRIFERIAREFNYMGFRKWRFRRVVKRHLLQDYSPEAPKASNPEKTVIYMSDGKRRHGGLADRLRGIVSLFQVCLEHGYDFRIFFTSPFPLEKYLLPARYDWRIRADQMSYNSESSLPVYSDTRKGDDDREKRWQHRVLSRQVEQKYRQIHCYTSFYFAENKFAELFNTLFRPAPDVEAGVGKVKRDLGNRYISVSTRFLELLGDFKEPKNIWTVLSDADAAKLMADVYQRIKEIQSLPENKDCRTLITSDSRRFLEYISIDPTLYAVPGNICHVDTKGNGSDDQLKTFVDFFAIKDAQRSYLVVGPGMYHSSNFSRRAAQAGGRDLILKEFQ